MTSNISDSKWAVTSPEEYDERVKYIRDRAHRQRMILQEKVSDPDQLQYGLRTIKIAERRCLARARFELEQLKK